MKIRKHLLYAALFIISLFSLTACTDNSGISQVEEIVQIASGISDEKAEEKEATNEETYSLSDLPAYSGKPYIEINQNVPYFTEEELTTKSFENYSELDNLGRCKVAYANISTDIMPTEKRGEIGMIKPSGWHTVKYEGIEGNYLYNRCHLIAFQLAGENDNEKNLITGTRSMNIEMIPFENQVADYVKETNHHVLYRVTPVYEGDNLLATGVLMEAQSVEDNEICFNVFLYNVQEGITLDYATGESKVSDRMEEKEVVNSMDEEASNNIAFIVEDANESLLGTGAPTSYILNTNTMKFHNWDCNSVDTIKDSNREEFYGNRDYLIENGYEPCKRCTP